MTSSVDRSLPGAPAGAHRARPRCVPRGRQARQPPRPGGTPRQHDRQELAARGARAIVPRAPAAASARPRDPGWGRAPPAPRGARSLSIRVCRLCVLTGPHLRPIGERRLEAITPQGADRQSGCPRPRPQSQAPMPNANRPDTCHTHIAHRRSRSRVSARDFDLGGGFQHSGSYPLVFQHSSGCHERAGPPGVRVRRDPRGVDPAPPRTFDVGSWTRGHRAHEITSGESGWPLERSRRWPRVSGGGAVRADRCAAVPVGPGGGARRPSCSSSSSSTELGIGTAGRGVIY